MAVNIESEVSSQTPSEIDSLLSHNKETSPLFHCKLGCQARRVQSKGAVLVLVWSYLSMSSSVCMDSLFQSVVPFRFEILDGVVTAALYLLAGWLADVYFGRYKVIRASILLIWLGSVLGTLLLVIHLLHPVRGDRDPVRGDALKYVSAVVAYVCTITGSAGLTVNVVPFGTDQMPGASSEEISAFIHWFAWVVYTGIASISIINLVSCSELKGDEANLVSMLFVVAVSSVALCLNFLFQKWLIVEPVCKNPLKTVLSVLNILLHIIVQPDAVHSHTGRMKSLHELILGNQSTEDHLLLNRWRM